jgi:hypothetical protein
MSSRKKKRRREHGSRGIEDPLDFSVAPVPSEAPVSDGVPSEAEAFSGPRCGYCGAGPLRESPRRGVRERWLRLGGSTVYRCESCGGRLAIAALTGREVRPEIRRRRAAVWATALVGLLTFLTVAWLIYRVEQRRLEVQGVLPVP